LALATRQGQTEEAKADAYVGITALVGRAITYLDLATHKLRCDLEDSGKLKSNTTIPPFRLPTPPPVPDFPIPFKSLWLTGAVVRTPLDGNTEAAASGGAETSEAPASILQGVPAVPEAETQGEEGAQEPPDEEDGH
jgi:hypothetical protein